MPGKNVASMSGQRFRSWDYEFWWGNRRPNRETWTRSSRIKFGTWARLPQCESDWESELHQRSIRDL